MIKRRDIPKGRRCVKSKWVFDIKRSGTIKTRLVVCGYSQNPGVDFSVNWTNPGGETLWGPLGRKCTSNKNSTGLRKSILIVAKSVKLSSKV